MADEKHAAVKDASSSPESPASLRRGSLQVDHNLASEADAAVLASMGYKQELKRNFTMIEVWRRSLCSPRC
jgi:hypothetical protein